MRFTEGFFAFNRWLSRVLSSVILGSLSSVRKRCNIWNVLYYLIFSHHTWSELILIFYELSACLVLEWLSVFFLSVSLNMLEGAPWHFHFLAGNWGKRPRKKVVVFFPWIFWHKKKATERRRAFPVLRLGNDNSIHHRAEASTQEIHGIFVRNRNMWI